METIMSPCVGMCALDEETDYCIGCFRSSEEIINWRDYDEKARISIMESLDGRRAKTEIISLNKGDS